MDMKGQEGKKCEERMTRKQQISVWEKDAMEEKKIWNFHRKGLHILWFKIQE